MITKRIIPFLVLILCFCVSCGKQKIQKLSNDRTMYKSAQALESCGAIQIPADIDFEGRFLFHFFRCFSDKTPDGQETMGSLLDIMSSFEISGMKNLTELLRYSNSTKNSKNEYPLIRMLITFFERGVVTEGRIDQQRYDERFGALQELFKSFDPSFIFNLILESQNEKQLQVILELFGDLFYQIDPNIFLSYLRGFLEKQVSQERVIQFVDHVVNYENLWNELTKMATFEKSFDLKFDSQSACMDSFLVTYSKTDTDVLCKMNHTNESKDGSVRIAETLSNLNQSQKKTLYQMIGDLFKNITDSSSIERLSKLQRFKKGAGDAWHEQKNPLLNIASVGDLIANTKASEMNHLVDAIKALIEDPNIPALFTANLKLGSTRLERAITELIYQGGKIEGCGDLIFQGVSGDFNEDEFYKRISRYFVLNPNCQYGLSPIINFAVKKLNDFNNCKNFYNEEFCISDQALIRLQKALDQSFFNRQKSDPSDNSDIFYALVLKVFDEVKKELEIEPYFLRFNHLAYGAVNGKVMEALYEKVMNSRELTPEKLAHIDDELNNNELFNKILVSDFLEKLIAKKIEELKMISYEFNNIAGHGTDYKLYRVFSGLYTSGPLEKFINNELRLANIKERLGDDIPRHIYRIKETLHRANGSSSLFHNNRLEYNDNELDFRLIGDKNRGMTFDEKGVFKFTRQKPLQIKDVFTNNFLRFDSLFKNGDLMGKDVAESDADQFSFWIEHSLYDEMINGQSWKKSMYQYPFNSRLEDKRMFFKITPYTMDEIRMIAHFNSINYLAIPMFLPRGDEAPFYLGADKTIRKQFFGPPIYGEYNWSTFRNYYPQLFNWKNPTSFTKVRQMIGESMTKDSFKKFIENAPWEFSLNEESHLYDVMNISGETKEIFNIYQSLNLLTQNKNKDYVPLLALKDGCLKSSSEKTDCPITFHENSGEQDLAFDNLKKYIADIYLLSLCPYLDPEKIGIDIGIILDSEEDRNFCNNIKNNYLTNPDGDYSVDENYPYRLRKSILNDIITMGKHNQLNPVLDSLVSRIRYHKGQLQKFPEKFRLSFWLNSPASVNSEMTAYSYKFSGDHKGFSSLKTGMLNAYLFFAENMINSFSSSRVYENALARYGAEVDYLGNPEKGKLYKFLYDVVINTHVKYQQKGSVSDWLVDMLFALKKNDDYMDIFSRLMINPSDNQTISMFKNLLGLYLKRIREIMEEDTQFRQVFWQQKGNTVIKQILKQDIWWMFTDVINQYSMEELKSFIESGLDLIPSDSEKVEDTQVIFKQLASFLKYQVGGVLVTKDHKEFVGSKLQESIAVFFKLKDGDLVFKSINGLIDEINQPQVDFNNYETESISKHFNKVSEWMLESMPQLMKIYQEMVVVNSKLKIHNDYLKRLINSFIDPLKAGNISNLGGVALADLLKISELGSFETVVKPILFPKKDKAYQKKFLDLIGAIGKIDVEIYKSSVIVLGQLLNGTKVLLNFITDKIDWEADTSDDAILAIKSINRMSDFNNGIWKAQEELLDIWLGKGINYRQIPLME